MAMPFDWKSLIGPGINLGMKAVGDIVAPDASLQNARTSARNSEADIALARAKMANANQIRSATLPGLYTNLGYSPQQGRSIAGGYSANTATPEAPQSGGVSGPSLGSKVGKAALNVGLGMAPSLISGALKGGGSGLVRQAIQVPGAAATAGTAAGGSSFLGSLGALATNPITIGAAAIGLGAYIWKKSQAHPTADKWVQGEQNPFDMHWRQIEESGLPPDQKNQAKLQSAQNYLQTLAQFQAEGGHNDEVARNAARTFRQYYGDPMKYGIQLPF